MEQNSLDEWTDGGSGESPDRCLSLTVRGPWGHFRRIEGNVVKQTYRIIPRTTVAGLLAAVLGIEKMDDIVAMHFCLNISLDRHRIALV